MMKTRLELLKARLYMVQAGLGAGLNQRQLLALDLPPISPDVEAMYRTFQEAGRQWPGDEGAPEDLFGGPEDDWFGGYFAKHGFQAAWNQAFDSETFSLDVSAFLHVLHDEIQDLKQTPTDQLYTDRERELYTVANYDWTYLPRLDLGEA